MIGKTLGHYQITEKPGKGWTGEVSPAEDMHTPHQVAFKILSDEFARDAEGLDCFKHDVMLLLSEELQGMQQP